MLIVNNLELLGSRFDLAIFHRLSSIITRVKIELPF